MSSHKIIIGDSRDMHEVADETVHLIVTSPPYFNIKELGSQPGNLSSIEDYGLFLDMLEQVWKECVRVLTPEGRICIDVLDFPVPSSVHGFVALKPLHSDIVQQFKSFSNMVYYANIIWLRSPFRRVTGRTGSTGGPMWGSYPYPPNILSHNIYEYILVFRKKGKRLKPDSEAKEKSRITIDELYEFTRPVWQIEGVTSMRKLGHLAIFPDEIPYRLIRMYTFIGDTVLDPFLGTGTSMKVARSLNRNSVGYEIAYEYLELIKEKVGMNLRSLDSQDAFEVIVRDEAKPRTKASIQMSSG